jgi:hypothetical protein
MLNGVLPERKSTRKRPDALNAGRWETWYCQAPGQCFPQYGQVNSPSARLNAWRQNSHPFAGNGRRRWGERTMIRRHFGRPTPFGPR